MGHEGLVHVDSVGRRHSRGHSKYKGPGAGGCLSCLGHPGGHSGLNKMIPRESCRRQGQGTGAERGGLAGSGRTWVFSLSALQNHTELCAEVGGAAQDEAGACLARGAGR